ncbi:hypothetical protein TYRP_016853, partial [Tyrophagus putrescentiae]
YGPISEGVKVGDRFKEHKSGIIFKNWVLDDDAINHFVVLVGYGETWFDNKPYWIIRNNWGKNGYALFQRSEDGYE